MDSELDIYNKMGGGEKYKVITVMNGGGKNRNHNKHQKRIKRLEEKIVTLQNELNKLKGK